MYRGGAMCGLLCTSHTMSDSVANDMTFSHITKSTLTAKQIKQSYDTPSYCNDHSARDVDVGLRCSEVYQLFPDHHL